MVNFFKVYFGRRVLFTISLFFFFIMPLIYLYAKSDSIVYGDIKLRFWFMIFLFIYLIMVIKVIKKKVAAMKNGKWKRLFDSSNVMIVLGIIYLIYSILEKAFIGADTFFGYLVSFEVIGFLLYNIDSFINDNWIREREYEAQGREQARIEYYKDRYKERYHREDENK